MIGRGRQQPRQTDTKQKDGKEGALGWGLKSWVNRQDSDSWSRSVGEGNAKGERV